MESQALRISCAVMTTFQQLLTNVKQARIDDLDPDEFLPDLFEYAEAQRAELASSFTKKKLEAKHSKSIFVSPEQEEVANKIVDNFMQEDSRLVTLIAEPQWGKTGTFLLAAYKLCTFPDPELMIDASQVYIITGLSDTMWEKQTRSRMLPQFEKNVYHRARINQISDELYDASNALIIIDECHYASGSDQTIKLMLEEVGLLDLEHLTTNNIRIIQTSATPDNVLIDSHSWGHPHHTVVKPTKKAPSYTSFADLLDSGRLRDNVNLADPCEAETIFDTILEFDQSLYHIIRIPRRGTKGERATIMENLNAFGYDNDIRVLYYNSENKLANIDRMLNIAPKKHTLIIIVDYWRAAKTLNEKYVGLVHERLVQKPNSTTIVQSLAGRCVGHNRLPDRPIIFTNVNAVKQYINLCQKEFNYLHTKYYSSGINSSGDGKVLVKDSYAHSISGLDHQYLDTGKRNTIGYKLFFENPIAEATKFVKKYLYTTLPKKKRNADGFYVQNDVTEDPLYIYSKYFDDDGFPFNKRIFKGLSGTNAKKETNWRQYALYIDPDDDDTLVWFVCWRRVRYPEAISD